MSTKVTGCRLVLVCLLVVDLAQCKGKFDPQNTNFEEMGYGSGSGDGVAVIGNDCQKGECDPHTTTKSDEFYFANAGKTSTPSTPSSSSIDTGATQTTVTDADATKPSSQIIDADTTTYRNLQQSSTASSLPPSTPSTPSPSPPTPSTPSSSAHSSPTIDTATGYSAKVVPPSRRCRLPGNTDPECQTTEQSIPSWKNSTDMPSSNNTDDNPVNPPYNTLTPQQKDDQPEVQESLLDVVAQITIMTIAITLIAVIIFTLVILPRIRRKFMAVPTKCPEDSDSGVPKTADQSSLIGDTGLYATHYC